MAKYTHVCSECGAVVEVWCSMDVRNTPKKKPHQTPDGEECSGTLERSEDLDMTAFTPYSWRP
jgi:hypothetical protein